MKTIACISVLVVAGATGCASQQPDSAAVPSTGTPAMVAAPSGTAPDAPASQADRDWAEVENYYKPPTSKDPVEMQLQSFRQIDGFLTVAEQFYRNHPRDPRRWMAVGRMHNVASGWFASLEFDPKLGEKVEPIISKASRQRWLDRIASLAKASEGATDVPDSERKYLALAHLSDMMAEGSVAQARGATPGLGAIRAELDKQAALGVGSEGLLGFHLKNYMGMRARAGATQEQLGVEWRSFAGSPNAAVRKTAEVELLVFDRNSKPIDLDFTAVDGRKVDLRDLRGKAVLVDFWATWCGPCVAELPNVKRIYEQYRAQGFEVIGIALERAGLQEGDAPEQAAAKLAKSKAKLVDFLARENMTWPNYFDGRALDSEMPRLFGVNGIPAMFLLDKEGKVAATEVRGQRLEDEVKRILNL